MRFQERCLERMRRFKASGVAIVFVSHNLSAIATLCDRVLVLKRGMLHQLGNVEAGLSAYASLAQQMNRDEGDDHPTQEVVVELRNVLGEPIQEVRPGDQVNVRAIASLPETGQPLGSAIKVYSLSTGILASFTISTLVGCPPVVASGWKPIEFSWTFDANLARGHYTVEFSVFEVVTRKIVCDLTPGPMFVVIENETQQGTTYLNARCSALAAIDQPCQSTA
jgi:energy-coupling factor transporter ATP-binding protein EcfA2